MLAKKFSKILKQKRKERGWSHSDLAEAISVSVRWYQNIESGKVMPNGPVMIRLQILLGIDPNDFLDEAGINMEAPIFRGTYHSSWKGEELYADA